jgi:phosphatidylglycerophosphate synthase
MDRLELFSLPNMVSLSRLLLACGFVATEGTRGRVALIGAAGLTDFLDGWLARRRHMATRLGALIDPIADRLFVLTVLASFLARGELTPLQCAILLSRDVMTLVGFFVARSISWLRAIPFQARPLGKVVTGFQLLTMLAVLLERSLVPALVIVVGLLSLASIADYTLMLWRQRMRQPAAGVGTGDRSS